MEAALKMGVTKDMTFKSSPKLHFDEFWSSNPQNAASPSSDYIFVDQLLNFSNEEEEEEEEAEGEEKNNHSSVSAPLQLKQHHDSDQISNHSSTNSSEDDFWSISSRDFEDLEWLSHLVADSTQEEYSAAPPPCSVFLTQKPINYQKETTHHRKAQNFEFNLNTPFPSKPRSKRAKISGRVWSLTNSIPSPSLYSPPAKKPKKNPAEESSSRVQAPRRCSHCGVQKTPNGEPVHLEQRVYVMRAVSGSNRGGFFPNTDRPVARRFRASFTRTTTGKYWRCDVKRKRRNPTPVWNRPCRSRVG